MRGGDGGRAVRGEVRSAGIRWARGDSSHGQQCQSCRGAWTRCQAAVDGWRHAAGKPCRGRARGAARRGQARGGRPGAARCWAGPSEARRVRGMLAGPASAGGPEARRRPAKEKNHFSKYIFKEIFKCHLSNIILSKKMTSFENELKMKVA